MSAGAAEPAGPVGELLRQWRKYRRFSQLRLASEADISTRHLSFVETGRAHPSRKLVLHLADHLQLPLRERNRLLLAAGYAPVYPETALGAPEMATVRAVIRRVLAAHQPYPAVVVDRRWNMVEANDMVGLLIHDSAPELLAPPTNVLRVTLHPEGLARRIVNLGQWRAHVLGRLRRQISLSPDPALSALHDELRGYPCEQDVPDAEVPPAGAVAIPLIIRHQGRNLSFLSTVAAFGTPVDITVAELVIESFFPAEPATAEALRAHAEAISRGDQDGDGPDQGDGLGRGSVNQGGGLN